MFFETNLKKGEKKKETIELLLFIRILYELACIGKRKRELEYYSV